MAEKENPAPLLGAGRASETFCLAAERSEDNPACSEIQIRSLADHASGAALCIAAFDPGLNGGGAILGRGALLACFDLPTIGEGAQRRIDAANLADLLREHGPYAAAFVEQAGARPGQGVSSMFRFGQAYGTILGVIGALAIPVRHVSPAKWKGALGLNSDAETSRARAIETWPTEAHLFGRKKDHNRAEAALLGLYGLRDGRNV
jgi:hypothetical protein